MQGKVWQNVSHAVMHLDFGWMCGWVLYSICTAVERGFLNLPNVNVSVWPGDLWLWPAACSLTCCLFWECVTPPHAVHPICQHVIAHDKFTRPSPSLALKLTNAGVRKPGYEAKFRVHTVSAPLGLQNVRAFGIVHLVSNQKLAWQLCSACRADSANL